MSASYPPQTANAAIAAATGTEDLKQKLAAAIRNGADDVPQAIKAISVLDPSLAPKALVASKSVYGPTVAAAVTWLATKYGIALDDNSSAVITGCVVLVVSAVLRYVTTKPIGNVFSKGKTT